MTGIATVMIADDKCFEFFGTGGVHVGIAQQC